MGFRSWAVDTEDLLVAVVQFGPLKGTSKLTAEGQRRLFSEGRGGGDFGYFEFVVWVWGYRN